MGLSDIGYRLSAIRSELQASLPVYLVRQVSDWGSGAAEYFGWMREAKRENTRYGL